MRKSILLTAALLAAVFILYPILDTVAMSLHRVDQFGHFKAFRGLANYVDLFFASAFRGALLRTVLWTVGIVVITTIISLGLAVRLNRRFRGRALARALLADPRILILDEATSSVDIGTERKIERALRTLLAGRTAFVIAHRLSTIRDADLIVVLEHGQVVEQGTHDELMRAGGLYTSLYGDWAADAA